MIKITAMPKDTLAQLILFLSENERFSSISENLAGSVTVEETRAVLRELAQELLREAAAESKGEIEDVKKGVHLSPRTKEIISYLSANEEKALLTAFGLVGKP